MNVTGDELAGVVDLFGGLTRAELGQALVELAFKRGEETVSEAFEADLDAAVDSYHLVACKPETGTSTGKQSASALLIGSRRTQSVPWPRATTSGSTCYST